MDPNCENELYANTLMSITRKIRPVCDFTGLPCGSVWYIRAALPDELPADEQERKEYNAPQVVILSQEAFESGKIPKCFDPASFKKETLSEKLEK